MSLRRVVQVVQAAAAVGALATVVLLFVKDPFPPPKPVTASTHPGAAIYAANCSGCHGPGGEGGTGPPLAPASLRVSYPDAAAQLTVVREGKGLMPAWGDDLSEQELTDVVAFTREFLGVESGSDSSLPGNGAIPVNGRVIWRAKCATCHGVNGEGTDAAPQLAGQMEERWPDIQTQIDFVTNGGGDGGGMPAWRGKLRPDEIVAVVEFTRDGLGEDAPP